MGIEPGKEDISKLDEAQAAEMRKKLERQNKVKVLKDLGTRELITRLGELETVLEKALREQTVFKNLNAGYLAAYGSDCSKAKEIIATLEPPFAEGGKKMTVAERENWLVRQRSANTDLNGTLNRQDQVTFELENQRIAAEMAKTRLDNVRAVIALRTAQIKFLSD